MIIISKVINEEKIGRYLTISLELICNDLEIFGNEIRIVRFPIEQIFINIDVNKGITRIDSNSIMDEPP
jgi:hypothetical protein